MSFDLHAHTTASDGTFSPRELVLHAKKMGLNGVAITDHDTLGGVNEALLAAEEVGITLIRGVELGTTWKNYEVHILGYCVNSDSASLMELFERMKQERIDRMGQMVENLRKNAHLDLTFEEVLSEAGDAVLGRPHLGRVLVHKGYASSLPDAFTTYLSRGKPGYAERPKLSPQEAVQILLEAGGVPVLAHPGLIGDDSILEPLIKSGLIGIETHHPDHDSSQRDHYQKLAFKYGLLATGGSDFHGKGAEHRGELGSVSVSDETAASLLSLAKSRGGK